MRLPPLRNWHPTQLVVGGFVVLILTGASLLWMPWSHADGAAHPGLVRCLFTATSAVSVTGLANVTPSDWSPMGEMVLMLLMQIGGFGIMTAGAVLVLLTSQKLGIRQRMVAQAEIGALTPGEVKVLARTIALATLSIEAVVALILTLRLWAGSYESLPSAIWSGVFHSIASFNNAGMSLYDDNLTRFVGDPVVVIVITLAIIVGGIGFPVILELSRERRSRRWSLHTKITLLTTAVLVVGGPLAVTVLEWTNARTLGSLPVPDRLLAGWLQGISPRTAGFNSVDIGGLRSSTLLVTIVLMFIGAGAASTAGGIKVTTFAVVGYAVWGEVRGSGEPTVFHRRLPDAAIRQALSVVALAIGSVVVGVLALVSLAPVELTQAGFETVSAFGTVGLSMGITGLLEWPSQFVLIAVMLAGRVGPTTFASALVNREQPRHFRYPEERPIIG